MNKIFSIFYPFIFCICIFSILVALYIEHVLSVSPCKLCLYQRIPYILSIIISIFGYFFLKNKIWIYLLILIFFSSSIISGYHFGIENNIFNEYSGCANESLEIIDKKELLQNLNNFLPTCKDINFRIFGLSLATINFVLSIALTIITIKYLFNEKNK